MPSGARSWTVAVVMLAALMASLNAAVTLDAGATAGASGAGSRVVTVGGVVSGPVFVSNATSTQ